MLRCATRRLTATSAAILAAAVGALLSVVSTSALSATAAFFNAHSSSTTRGSRYSTSGGAVRHSLPVQKMGETVHELPGAATAAAAAAATTTVPGIATGACDFDTLVDRYRVRPRAKSERLSHTDDRQLSLFGAAAAKVEADEVAAALSCGLDDDDKILVIEDLSAPGESVGSGSGGGAVAFCGTVGASLLAAPLETTRYSTATEIVGVARRASYYVSMRKGREIDSLTARLFVRALRGWLDPEAARGAGWCKEEDGEEEGAEREREEEGEMVDWVDTKGRVICPLPRPVVHSRNVLHRGAGVMIRNKEGEVYCHRRASTKRVFPSMYDMFIGGVSGASEPVATTALRELGEELGLGPYGGDRGGGAHGSSNSGSSSSVAEDHAGDDAPPPPPPPPPLLPASLRYRGECLVQTGYNRCVVSVFDYLVGAGEAVRWQEEEVEWGSYLPWDKVVAKVSGGDWEFVPDGLQVWRHYLEWEAADRE